MYSWNPQWRRVFHRLDADCLSRDCCNRLDCSQGVRRLPRHWIRDGSVFGGTPDRTDALGDFERGSLPLFLISNARIVCGRDAKSSNNRAVKDGTLGATALPGNVYPQIFFDNVLFQGIAFRNISNQVSGQGVARAGIALFATPTNVVFLRWRLNWNLWCRQKRASLPEFLTYYYCLYTQPWEWGYTDTGTADMDDP